MQKKTFTFAYLTRVLTLFIALIPLFSLAQCPPAQPTLTSSSPTCVGGTITLTAPVVAGAQYLFTGPNSYSSGLINTNTVTVTTSATAADGGTYGVTIFNFSCPLGSQQSAFGFASVAVNASLSVSASASPSTTCSGGTFTLSTPVSGGTYTWTGPGGAVIQSPSSQTTIVTNAVTGTYSVTVDLNGCIGTGTVNVTANAAGPTAPVITLTSVAPACTGTGTIDLVSNNTGTGSIYAWTGPDGWTTTGVNPAARTNVTPAMAGTYSLTVTRNGCTASTTIDVAVNQGPNAMTVGASPNPVCTGSNLSLTASNAGTGATYSWSGPGGFFASTRNATVSSVTTANAGIYSLTVTRNGCTATATTSAITVGLPLATPTVTVNTNPICEGPNTLTLTASNAGTGATYAWSGPNLYTSTTRITSRTPMTLSDAGVYTVVVTRNGCTATGTSAPIVVTPRPVVPVVNVTPAPVCDGGTINLTTTFIGAGVTYAWTGPNSFSSTEQNPVRAAITPADAGIYSLIVTQNGCSSPLAVTIPLVVNPLPATPNATASHTTICTGQTLTLTASDVASAIAYAWSGPAGFSVNGKIVTRSVTSTNHAGMYEVVAIDANGCASSPAAAIMVAVDPAITGVPQIPAITVCEDSPVSFMVTAPVPAATSYSWAKPASAPSTLNNATMQTADISAAAVADAGVYTVTITRGVCTLNRTVNLTVNARPAPFNITSTPADAGGVVTVCDGSNVVFGGPAAPALDAYTYSWSGSRGTRTTRNYALNGANPARVTDSGYNFDLIVTNSKGCTRPSSNSLQLIVNPIPAKPVPAVNSTSICTGDELMLMANTIADSYSWVGPNGFSSNSQNPTLTITNTAQAGIYSLVVTTLGCSSAAAAATQVNVRVSPNPPAVYPNTPMTLCAGETLALSTPVVGVSYSWQVNGISPNFTVQNPIIPGITAANSGSATLTITAANGCIASASTAPITVATPISAAISAAPAAVLCSGENLTLSAPAYTGATYTWKGPNFYYLSGVGQNVATISGVTAANAGTYTLQIEQAGCIATGSIAVAVKNSPAIPSVSLSPNSVCPGETITLSTNATGVAYVWSGPQTPSPTNTATTFVYGVNTPGSYTLTVIADNGCIATAVTEPVTVKTRPVVDILQNDPISICAGQTLNLDAMATPNNGVVYNWSGPNGWTAIGQSASRNNIQAVEAGIYAVVATLAGCTSEPDAVSVLVSPAPLAPAISAMPNPFCIGSPVYFSTPVVDAAIYEWTSPNGFSSASNIPNPFISATTGSNAGNYTLKITVNGCESPISTYTLSPVNIATPTMLLTRNATTNSLTAVWQAAPGISQYTLEYRVVGANSWMAIGPFVASTDANPANRFRTVSGLQPGTNYEFRVKSILGSCQSENSNIIIGTTLTLTASCRIPTGLFANVNSSNAATINWTPAPGGQCSIIAVGITGTNPALWPNITIPAPASSYLVEGLIPGTSYSYRIRTNCTAGCPSANSILSSWTIIQQFSTPLSDARLADVSTAINETLPTVSVYPNPNKGAFTLKLENFSTNSIPVQILDMTGRVVYSQNVQTTDVSIDLTDQARGIYLVKVGEKSTKVVIE